jgi:hypothetical protein
MKKIKFDFRGKTFVLKQNLDKITTPKVGLFKGQTFSVQSLALDNWRIDL